MVEQPRKGLPVAVVAHRQHPSRLFGEVVLVQVSLRDCTVPAEKGERQRSGDAIEAHETGTCNHIPVTQLRPVRISLFDPTTASARSLRDRAGERNAF